MKILSATLLLILSVCPVVVAQDPGTESIGTMSVELIYATNGDAAEAGAGAKKLDAERIKELQKLEKLDYTEYRLLGADVTDILNGYEGWATPINPSKEILVSFQPIKRVEGESLQMVLEYWQSKRKVLSANPTLTKGKSFYLVGPKWRKGRVIVAVKILSLDK